MKGIIISGALIWVASVGLAYWVGKGISSDERQIETKQSTADSVEDSQLVASEGELKNKTADLTATDLATDVTPPEELDPLSRLKDLFGNPNSDQFAAETALLIQQLGPEEIPDVLAMLKNLPASEMSYGLMVEVLQRWAKFEPEAAITYSEEIDSLQLKDRALGSILEGWGEVDSVSAFAWLNGNSATMSSRNYQRYFLDIVEGYAQTDPYSAFSYINTLSEESSLERRLKNEGIEEVLDAMAAQGQLETALNWVQGMPEGNTKHEALEEIVERWAAYNPDAALSFIETLGSVENMDDLRRTLISSWSRTDPESAANWLSSISPEEGEYSSMVTSLIRNWTRYDIDGPAEWLNEMPPSPEIDRAVAVFTFRSIQDDPETAMTWAESVTNENMRDRLMTRVAGEWKQQDNQAFNEYLETSSLSPDRIEALKNASSRGNRWRGRDR